MLQLRRFCMILVVIFHLPPGFGASRQKPQIRGKPTLQHYVWAVQRQERRIDTSQTHSRYLASEISGSISDKLQPWEPMRAQDTAWEETCERGREQYELSLKCVHLQHESMLSLPQEDTDRKYRTLLERSYTCENVCSNFPIHSFINEFFLCLWQSVVWRPDRLILQTVNDLVICDPPCCHSVMDKPQSLEGSSLNRASCVAWTQQQSEGS